MEEYRHTACVLKVNTQSSGWEKSLTKVIQRFKGVSYTIDALQGVVRISGRIDPNKVLNDIKKAGKHAELIHVECGHGNHHHNHRSNRAHEYGYGGYDGGYGKMEHQQRDQHFYDFYHDGDFIEPSAPPVQSRALLLPPPNAPQSRGLLLPPPNAPSGCTIM